ncbi:MAG: hypothetical protein COA91_13760 [Robiginitomaculum sp.]|nr:MAG: hypothetical protein COA91_13760 [Robiginitomaculum sp.]
MSEEYRATTDQNKINGELNKNTGANEGTRDGYLDGKSAPADGPTGSKNLNNLAGAMGGCKGTRLGNSGSGSIC